MGPSRLYRLTRTRPEKIKDSLLRQVRSELGPDYDVDKHFTPAYNPWDQRLCLCLVRPANRLHALGFSLYASSNLLEYCQRLVRFFRIICEAARYHLHEEQNAFCLQVEVTQQQQAFEAIDAVLYYTVKFCRDIYRADFKPLRIELQRPRPDTHADEFAQYFQTEIVFSATENRIYFKKEDMRAQLPMADTELARHNDEVAIEYPARLAKELILSGKVSMVQVAERLGCSAPAAFSHAFKRWTGKSPSTLR